VGLDNTALFNSLVACDAVSFSGEFQTFRRNAVGACLHLLIKLFLGGFNTAAPL
jgi:hypothetical protein